MTKKEDIPSVRVAVKQLAKALLDIDLATSTDDPYLRDEIKAIKKRVVKLYTMVIPK